MRADSQLTAFVDKNPANSALTGPAFLVFSRFGLWGFVERNAF
jgi:hypothetical protein